MKKLQFFLFTFWIFHDDLYLVHKQSDLLNVLKSLENHGVSKDVYNVKYSTFYLSSVLLSVTLFRVCCHFLIAHN